mmetsp:Transcript_58945/g.96870  ORF Transcript_58945/g.96870 Transcript_58945/m.96870 type:complete len:284 (-) Transcript_58945:181-1032(-)
MVPRIERREEPHLSEDIMQLHVIDPLKLWCDLLLAGALRRHKSGPNVMQLFVSPSANEILRIFADLRDVALILRTILRQCAPQLHAVFALKRLLIQSLQCRIVFLVLVADSFAPGLGAAGSHMATRRSRHRTFRWHPTGTARALGTAGTVQGRDSSTGAVLRWGAFSLFHCLAVQPHVERLFRANVSGHGGDMRRKARGDAIQASHHLMVIRGHAPKVQTKGVFWQRWLYPVALGLRSVCIRIQLRGLLVRCELRHHLRRQSHFEGFRELLELVRSVLQYLID